MLHTSLSLEPTPKTNPGVCYGYSRVSTAEQAASGLSLEYQEQACKKAFNLRYQDQGWFWGGMHRDDGVSAKIPLRDRPSGAKLVAGLRKGDVLLSVRSDRLFRSTKDAANSIEDFLSSGVTVFMISTGMEVRSDDFTSKMFFSIMASVDQFSRELTGARTREAMLAKRMRGEWPRKIPPLGFTFIGRILQADNRERAIMSKIYAWYSSGSTGPEIELMLKKYDLRRTFTRTFFTRGQIRSVFREEPSLRKLQKLIVTGKVDPMSVPPQYRFMHRLPVCEKYTEGLS